MNVPDNTKELMKLTLEQKLAHGGHPVLRWMMDNIFIRTDPAGNIKADKEKSTEKIDGVVATIMALDRALRNDGAGSNCAPFNSLNLLLTNIFPLDFSILPVVGSFFPASSFCKRL